MQLKHLPPKTRLIGLKVKTPSGRIGYWVGQWEKAIWLTEDSGDGVTYPYFLNDLQEAAEWEIVEEKNK